MPAENCGIIAIRQEDILGFQFKEGYLAECICPFAHIGPHVIKTPNGKYYAWEDDFSCDCCEPEEGDRCYVHWEINKEEVEKYIQGRE